MILPQIPTDNLYKFIFVSGLVMIGASIFLYINRSTDLYKSIDEIEMDLLNLQSEKFKDSINISSLVDREEKALKMHLIRMDYIDTLFLKNQKIIPNEIHDLRTNLSKSTDSLWSITDQMNKSKISLNFLEKKISYKIQKLKKRFTRLYTVIIISSIGLIAGIYLTIVGFRLWYYKVQKPMDERIKLELKKIKMD